ncbi:hypothetical protein [Sphingobacterium siyangense]|uniref:hypothetical protein n=1 Tax=Sphingobacterium siyangense TaxID=459529 RepID=UPI002FD8EF56
MIGKAAGNSSSLGGMSNEFWISYEETVTYLFKLHYASKRFSGDYWLDVVMLK